MRAAEPGALLELVVRELEDTVLPAVDDRSARSMLWIIIGLLDNLATRVVEDPALAAGRATPIREVLDDLPAALERVHASAEGHADDDRLRLVEALRRLRALEPQTWGEAEEDWLARCRDAAAARTAAELERMRSTRYGRSLGGP